MEEEHIFTTPNTIGLFFRKVNAEIARAEEKFPDGDRLLGALMEEVGELAQALLKIKESGESPQNVYDEAIQVATVAYRLAVQGEPDYGYEGTSCSYIGCGNPCLKGPCHICYE